MPRPVVALIASLALAGCGDDPPATPDDTPVAEAKVVTGSVKLEQAAGGPPDAGTQAGHGGGGARGATRRSRFSFDGIVAPPESDVTITGTRSDVRAGVRMIGDHGDFTVVLSNLRHGPNRFTLTAAAPGYEPWTQDVVITRRR